MAKGLAALETVFTARKLLAARRLLLRGETLDVPAMRARGAVPDRSQETWLTEFAGLASEVIAEHLACDGARRLEIRLADGERVESVVMGDGGVCVSTQVGCAVGCRFCASGIAGLARNLTSEEILEQVAHARRIDPRLGRVVYMGIGEPTHNLDAVLAAAAVLAEAADIHERSQTLSTVGSVRALERLRTADVRPSLAVSVHAADDTLRRSLLPRAGKDSIADIVAAADAYADATGREVQYAVALLAGVNDRECDAEGLIRLMAGRRGYVNLIPWNHVPGADYARPERDAAAAFAKRLRDRGIFTTLRWSVGVDADAACGQLRRDRLDT